MSPLMLLRTLRTLGVELTPMPDGTLWACVTTGVLSAALRQEIHTQREALRTMVTWYDERASLMEYDGGMPREDAERQAWACLLEEFDDARQQKSA